MKNIYSLVFLLFTLVSFSQEKNQPNTDPIYSLGDVEIVPEFPGGNLEFRNYIMANFKPPQVKGLKGKVFVEFVVEKDGSVTNVKVVRDIGYGSGEEAKRVIENSPKWTPGTLKGEPIRAKFMLPLTVNVE